MSDEKVRIEVKSENGCMELTGLNGEIELSQRIVDAVANDRELVDCVAIHIAHNRAEQLAVETGQVIGQLVAEQIENVYGEIHQRLQSSV